IYRPPPGHSLLQQHYRLPRHLPSFPTRRSSDLPSTDAGTRGGPWVWRSREPFRSSVLSSSTVWSSRRGQRRRPPQRVRSPHRPRSEEHTSELQSRFDLVCRLLLEKKKHKGRRTY